MEYAWVTSGREPFRLAVMCPRIRADCWTSESRDGFIYIFRLSSFRSQQVGQKKRVLISDPGHKDTAISPSWSWSLCLLPFRVPPIASPPLPPAADVSLSLLLSPMPPSAPGRVVQLACPALPSGCSRRGFAYASRGGHVLRRQASRTRPTLASYR